MSKIEVITVIESVAGDILQVKNFSSVNVLDAEKFFVSLIKENFAERKFTLNEIEDYLDDGVFNCDDFQIVINWNLMEL